MDDDLPIWKVPWAWHRVTPLFEKPWLLLLNWNQIKINLVGTSQPKITLCQNSLFFVHAGKEMLPWKRFPP